MAVTSALLLATLLQSRSADEQVVVVSMDGKRLEVTGLAESSKLWLRASDLQELTGFALKAEGLCRDRVCLPVNPQHRDELVWDRQEEPLVNLAELARKLGRVVAMSDDPAVWWIGDAPRPPVAAAKRPVAPDFTLPDLQGEKVSLSDFAGQKVLLVTWASW